MKFKRKGFLSLALTGVLLVSASTQASAYSIGGCSQWLQRSATTLFSSKSFQRFAPAVVVTGIVALGALWYIKSKKKKELLDTNGTSQETDGNVSDSETNFTAIGPQEETHVGKNDVDANDILMNDPRGTGLAFFDDDLSERTIEGEQAANNLVCSERECMEIIEKMERLKEERNRTRDKKEIITIDSQLIILRDRLETLLESPKAPIEELLGQRRREEESSTPLLAEEDSEEDSFSLF